MRLTRLFISAETAMATARYVFPVPAGPIPKHQVVPLDGFHVTALIYGLGRQRFLAEVPLPAAMHQTAQGHLGVFGNDPKVAVEVAIGEALAFLDQRDVVLQNARGADHVRLLALDFQGIIHQAGGNI